MLQRRAVSCCSLWTQTRGSAEGQAGRGAGCSAPSAETKVSFEKSERLLKGTVVACDGFLPLKVPKCEIFDRSDFNDFYTITSLREGDCGVKI